MAKETWIQVGHGFVSFRRSGGWKGVVFFEATLKVVNRCFFFHLVIILVRSNNGTVIWNRHHFKTVEELPK